MGCAKELGREASSSDCTAQAAHGDLTPTTAASVLAPCPLIAYGWLRILRAPACSPYFPLSLRWPGGRLLCVKGHSARAPGWRPQ